MDKVILGVLGDFASVAPSLEERKNQEHPPQSVYDNMYRYGLLPGYLRYQHQQKSSSISDPLRGGGELGSKESIDKQIEEDKKEQQQQEEQKQEPVEQIKPRQRDQERSSFLDNNEQIVQQNALDIVQQPLIQNQNDNIAIEEIERENEDENAPLLEQNVIRQQQVDNQPMNQQQAINMFLGEDYEDEVEEEEEELRNARTGIMQHIRNMDFETLNKLGIGITAILQYLTREKHHLPMYGANNNIFIEPTKWTNEEIIQAIQFEKTLSAKEIPKDCRRYIYYDREGVIHSYVICQGNSYQEE